MSSYHIDQIDQKILSFLVKNARMPFLEIARECGVTWCTLDRFIKHHLNDKPPKPLNEPPKRHGHPTILEKQWFAKHT